MSFLSVRTVGGTPHRNGFIPVGITLLKRPNLRLSLRLRRVLRIGAIFVLFVIACLTVDYWAYPYGAATGGKSFNKGENGLWLRYTWRFGEHSPAETEQLARNLRDRQIRYAYFHVRSINAQGRLAFHHAAEAQRLNDLLRKEAPEVQSIAWVYAGNARGQGKVKLSDSAVRKAMIAEALWLVNECGFAGIQWDYEICDDGDRDFLALLRETRTALPPGKTLSIASAVWMPAPLGKWGWSEAYFADAARECDQITVMCYDTGFYLPRSYVWLVGQQARRIPRVCYQANPRCRVLLGLPTYGPGFLSHNPRAENISMALRGVREGLAASGADKPGFAGVALFADYTTEPDEWQTYENLWLRP